MNTETLYIYTKILEVNLFAFAYRLFHEDLYIYFFGTTKKEGCVLRVLLVFFLVFFLFFVPLVLDSSINRIVIALVTPIQMDGGLTTPCGIDNLKLQHFWRSLKAPWCPFQPCLFKRPQPLVSINNIILTLNLLVVTIDEQWEWMGDVGSARYEPALLPPCPTIRVLSYSN